MHEKILIPPAVHDEPHFAKKTLVLAVLLSATFHVCNCGQR